MDTRAGLRDCRDGIRIYRVSLITRPQIGALVLIAVALIAATRLIAGEQESIGWFTSIGVAVAILDGLVIAAFN